MLLCNEAIKKKATVAVMEDKGTTQSKIGQNETLAQHAPPSQITHASTMRGQMEAK